MFVPPYFNQTNEDQIADLIASFPLATLICHSEEGFAVNHIPLLRQDKNLFIGHIAKENSLHRIFPQGTKAVAVFTGEDSYVSPNWYPSKQQTHRHVPTWNYQVVHLHGSISFDHSAKAKLAVVGRLTATHEKFHEGENGWRISDAPKEYIAQLLDELVVVEFTVSQVIAKSKLSQNRSVQDRAGVAEKMANNNKLTLYQAMTKDK